MSALPKAVQKQRDDANKILQQISEDSKESAQAEGANHGEDVREEGTVQHGERPQPEGQGEAREQPPQQQAQEDLTGSHEGEEAGKEDPAEQRYRVLKGKYDAEVPRLHRQLSEVQGQLQGMRELVATLQTRQESHQEEQTPPQKSVDISEAEVEEFGSDLIDLIGRKASQVLTGEVSKIWDKIRDLEQGVGGVKKHVVQSARDKVFAALDGRIENWRDINTDPAFLEWLDRVDPFTGQQRGQQLRKAFEENDPTRVIAFFNGFLQENAAVSPPPGGSHAQEQGGKGKPKVDMGKLVAPGKPRAGTAGAQSEKRVWTQKEIQDFYRDVSRGRFKGREDEQRVIEKDILAAAAEDRLR